MDRSGGPLLASALGSLMPAEAPKLRRKLQKVAKQRGPPSKRPEAPNGSGRSKFHGRNGKLGPSQVQAQPSLPSPPDLSDSKWLEYVRGSGFLYSLDSSAQSRNSSNVPAVHDIIIPEFRHLDCDDAKPRIPPDTLQPDSPSSFTSSIMRRRAKTPVFKVGQLEGFSQARETRALTKMSSVELIAEQYRALLESRNSMLTDSHSEPPPSRQGEEHPPIEIRRSSVEDLHMEGPPNMVQDCSPTSDDGTLVAFEEETVYFKPVSFSPEPPSPAQPPDSFPVLSPPRTPDNLSLQICLDLLTRELSSAMADRPRRSPSENTSLQIWVMIEAYERLRDQLFELQLPPDELRPMEMMFDMWLRALYTIHDSLTGDSRASESDYDTLEAEDVD